MENMRELNMEELEDINGGSFWGDVGNVLGQTAKDVTNALTGQMGKAVIQGLLGAGEDVFIEKK